MFKKCLFLFLFYCTTHYVSAQLIIKDTASFLFNAFIHVTGEIRTYKNGKLDYVNRYTITQFSLDHCTLTATVKMSQQYVNKSISTYTLTYSIPLKDINEVKPTENKDSSELFKKGALHFGMPYDIASIHYTFYDDALERIEADGLYAKADLWCKEEEIAQVMAVLNGLRKRCAVKLYKYNLFSNGNSP